MVGCITDDDYDDLEDGDDGDSKSVDGMIILMPNIMVAWWQMS